ncbi:probable calcium-binding protein CML26 [Cryptomeria japonica]|uniref:probable calcium-binding protein CML26 n=1 Tax=Cryptomeria japonica TaxID=3369 RepID=UPI0027DA1CAD|nr:probable calcium-binding protein CML26 [Cryptomeria japonica]
MGSAEEIRDEGFLETLFRRFDGNGDEKLCREEMNLLTKTLGVKLTKEEIDCLMDCTDEDRDGCLNFTEFVKMYRFLMSCAGNGFKDVNVREAFDLFDKNGDGFICPSDIHNLLLNLGLIEEHADFQKITGEVDFEEFKKMVTDQSLQ